MNILFSYVYIYYFFFFLPTQNACAAPTKRCQGIQGCMVAGKVFMVLVVVEWCWMGGIGGEVFGDIYVNPKDFIYRHVPRDDFGKYHKSNDNAM